MFHLKSVSFTGDATVAHNANVLSSGHHQNENLIHGGNQQKSSEPKTINYNGDITLGRTKPIKFSSKNFPGKKASGRRRAFGDISNKKVNSGFGKESSSAKQNTQRNNVIKTRSKTTLPRSTRSLSTAQNTPFSILSEKSKPSRLDGALDQVMNNTNTIGTQSALLKQRSLTITTTEVKGGPTLKLEPVPDIERSAGRTWMQQLEYDLKLEDDLASISSIESILKMESCFSPHERWTKERDTRWKLQKEKEDEEDRLVYEQFQASVDREQKEDEEGLDSLYDAIDNLEVFSDISLDERTNNLQEEEWTIQDLSRLDLNLSDDLPFPL